MHTSDSNITSITILLKLCCPGKDVKYCNQWRVIVLYLDRMSYSGTLQTKNYSSTQVYQVAKYVHQCFKEMPKSSRCQSQILARNSAIDTFYAIWQSCFYCRTTTGANKIWRMKSLTSFDKGAPSFLYKQRFGFGWPLSTNYIYLLSYLLESGTKKNNWCEK